MSGLLYHDKGGVEVVTGSFSGAGGTSPTIVSGAGSFTVARTGTTTSTVYTVTLQGRSVPVAQKMTILLTVEDAALTGATDCFLVNVASKDAAAGTFVIQARDVAGAAGVLQTAAVVHFAAVLQTASEVVI